MKPEAQRIAIAEACGWTPTPNGHWTMDPAGLRGPYVHTLNLPDYLADLNAMHEAESLFFSDKWIYGWGKYTDYLMHVLGDAGEYETPYFYATAAQRAEAFLRTIGKWEDDK